MHKHFTHIESNVKEKISVSLGPLTAISGEEASYKSAIGIAMRLALTGEYEAVGKHPSDLMTLAEDALVGITVLLEGESGKAEWRLRVDQDSKKPKKPEPPHFEGPIAKLTEDERYRIIPTDSVRDLLKNAKGEKKLRESMIRRFGGALTDIPEPFALLPEELEKWTSTVARLKRDLGLESTADTLLANLSEHFRLESGRIRREITPLEKLIKEKRRVLADAGVGGERLPEFERRLKLANERQLAVEDEKSLKSLETTLVEKKIEIANAKAEVEAGQQEFERLCEEQSAKSLAAQKVVDEARDELGRGYRRLGSAETNVEVYTRYRTEGKTTCPYCSNGPTDIKASLEHFERQAKERLEAIQKLERDVKQAESNINDVQMQDPTAKFLILLTDKEKAVWAIEKTIKQCEDAIEALKIKGLLKFLEAPVENVEKLKADIESIRSVNRARLELEKEGIKVRTLEKEYESLKTLEKEAEDMQKRVMISVAETASNEVSLGMTGGRRAVLDSKTLEWYVVRQDGEQFGPWGALCGTERTSLLLGLAAAWTRGSPLRIAIFDDEDMVGLSGKGLSDFYRQCEELYDKGDFSQVIVISNWPAHIPANRWLRILKSVGGV